MSSLPDPLLGHIAWPQPPDTQPSVPFSTSLPWWCHTPREGPLEQAKGVPSPSAPASSGPHAITAQAPSQPLSTLPGTEAGGSHQPQGRTQHLSELEGAPTLPEPPQRQDFASAGVFWRQRRDRG